MQTKFDEDGLPLATNHTGWNVEGFEGIHGWTPMHEQPITEKCNAKILLEHFKSKFPQGEFRVYEALK